MAIGNNWTRSQNTLTTIIAQGKTFTWTFFRVGYMLCILHHFRKYGVSFTSIFTFVSILFFYQVVRGIPLRPKHYLSCHRRWCNVRLQFVFFFSSVFLCLNVMHFLSSNNSSWKTSVQPYNHYQFKWMSLATFFRTCEMEYMLSYILHRYLSAKIIFSCIKWEWLLFYYLFIKNGWQKPTRGREKYCCYFTISL